MAIINNSETAIFDPIVCKCGTTYRTRQKLGTVQCGTCLNLPHLACYNLTKRDTGKGDFVFTCAICSTPEPRIQDMGRIDSHPSSAHRIDDKDEGLTTSRTTSPVVCLCSNSDSCAVCKNNDLVMLCK